MGKKFVEKFGIWGGVVGLVGGVVAVVLTGGAGLVGVIAWAGALAAGGATGAGCGAAAGAVAGAGTDIGRTVYRRRGVQILGPSQSGKNSVHGTITGNIGEPSPTTPGTKSLYKNPEGVDIKKSRLKLLDGMDDDTDQFVDICELAGEDHKAWHDVIVNSNPDGIIYVVDSCTSRLYQDNEALRASRVADEIRGILTIEKAWKAIPVNNRKLHAIMIIINKIDELSSGRNHIEIVEGFRKTFLSQVIDQRTIETIIRSMLRPDTPIRVHGFCGHWEKRSNFLEINRRAVSQFNEDLHR